MKKKQVLYNYIKQVFAISIPSIMIDITMLLLWKFERWKDGQPSHQLTGIYLPKIWTKFVLAHNNSG